MYTSVAEREKRNGSIYTRLGPFLKWTKEVPCERKAYLDPIWDWSEIYPVLCKRGLNILEILQNSYSVYRDFTILRSKFLIKIFSVLLIHNINPTGEKRSVPDLKLPMNQVDRGDP